MDTPAFYFVCLLASVWLIAQIFLPKYRNTTRWLRSAISFAGLIFAIWAGLGLFLSVNRGHLGPRSWALDHLKQMLCGMFVGILVLVATNPEYRKIRRSSRPASLAE
jgi:hypothetical protein